MKRLFKKAVSLTVLGSLFASLGACGTDNFSTLDPSLNNPNAVNTLARKSRTTAKWTIAIHLAADNNLYYAGLDDINEMEAGLNSDDVNVIVLFDGAKQGDSKIYKIKHDSNGYDRTIISEELDDGGYVIPASKEIDSGDPKVFHKFVDWVTKNYPADRNFIEIWNHGSGIYRLSRNVNNANYPLNGSSYVAKPVKDIKNSSDATFSSKAFASDDRGGEMHLKDLNPAFATAMQNLGKKVDVLGFDTCLMGHMETAYQVKGLANYLVASEELEPGDGWDYEAYLKAVSKNPGMDAATLTTHLVDAFGKSYAPGGSQSGRDVTLSSVDINRVTDELVPALGDLADSLTQSLPSALEGLSVVRNNTESYYNRDAADLGHFLDNLNKDTRMDQGLRAKAQRVRKAYDNAVVRETHSGKVNGVSNASGMVVYFPRNTMSYNRKYDSQADIRFAENPQWGSFLKKFTAK